MTRYYTNGTASLADCHMHAHRHTHTRQSARRRHGTGTAYRNTAAGLHYPNGNLTLRTKTESWLTPFNKLFLKRILQCGHHSTASSRMAVHTLQRYVYPDKDSMLLQWTPVNAGSECPLSLADSSKQTVKAVQLLFLAEPRTMGRSCTLVCAVSPGDY